MYFFCAAGSVSTHETWCAMRTSRRLEGSQGLSATCPSTSLPQSFASCITSFPLLTRCGPRTNTTLWYSISRSINIVVGSISKFSDSSKGVQRTKSGSYAPEAPRWSPNASLLKRLRNQQRLQRRHKWLQPFSPCQENLLSHIRCLMRGSQLGSLPINLQIWSCWIYPTLG